MQQKEVAKKLSIPKSTVSFLANRRHTEPNEAEAPLYN